MDKLKVGDSVRVLSCGTEARIRERRHQISGYVYILDGIEDRYFIERELEKISDEVDIGKCRIKNNEKQERVNSPSYYNQGKYEVIDVIEDWRLGFNLGNAIKYIARCEHKENKLQDLKKAKYYIKREIENERKKQDDN